MRIVVFLIFILQIRMAGIGRYNNGGDHIGGHAQSVDQAQNHPSDPDQCGIHTEIFSNTAADTVEDLVFS